MADYSTIKGFNVETLSSDPYASAAASGTWASGTNMPAGYNGLGGFGTATAATMAGSPAPTGFEYDGTTWTATPALNTSGAPRYYPGSLGTSQSAGMIIGGEPGVSVSETWNGTAWSEGSNINTGRNFMGGCGITTAGIIAGGLQPSLSAKVETYNGTSWAEAQVVPTSLAGNQMGGTSTAAISVSGMDTAPNTVTAVTNEWDGTSWTAVNSVNTARDMMGGDGPTIATTLIYGGQIPPNTKQTKTEGYDGTTWTEGGDLATGRRSYGSAGSISASVFAGGDPSPAGQTEEWTSASPLSLAQEGQVWYNSSSSALKAFGYTIGTGAWASGGNLPTNRGNYGACGIQTATVSAGGYDGPVGILNNTILYDGTAWSSGNNLNQTKDHNFCFGIQTAAVSTGGVLSPPGVHQSTVEEYDGTNWTEVTNVPTSMVGAGTAGSLTAGLIMGGSTGTTPAGAATSFEYDGTNWTAGGALNKGRYRAMGQSIGLQTAALYVGGFESSPAAPGVLVEEYDGSTWTEVADLNNKADLGGGSGISTSAIKISGRDGPPSYTTIGTVETYDGTSWTEVANVSSARAYCSATGSGAGTKGNTTALFFGGATTSSTPNTTATEEWNIPTSYTIKTFTAS